MRILRTLYPLIAFLIALATCQNSTSVVTWDEYSLKIRGERVLIYSGEFHYARLPVPELWRDVFQKFKANGLNAVSVSLPQNSFVTNTDWFSSTSFGAIIVHVRLYWDIESAA